MHKRTADMNEGNSDPCGVREFMARTSTTLMRLESFEATATTKLEKLEDMEKSLATIASHAGDTATQLQSLRADMKDWVPLIAGKNHVPLHIFLVVTLVMAILALVAFVSSRGGEFEAGYNKLKYRSYYQDDRSFGKREDSEENTIVNSDLRRGPAPQALP